MVSDLRFTRLPERPGQAVPITFGGKPLDAREGDSVAAALLAAGHAVTRTSAVSDAARGPFCMIGQCFECLVEIDGQPNRQSCLVPVRAGMRVERMDGARLLSVIAEDD